MEIQINDNYRIQSDSHCFILQELKRYTKVKDKKDDPSQNYWKNIGYYGDIKQLYEALINKKIKDLDTKSWKNLLKAIRDFTDKTDVIRISDVRKD